MDFTKRNFLWGLIGSFVLTWLFCGCTLYYVKKRTYRIGTINSIRLEGQLRNYAIKEAHNYYKGLKEELIYLEEKCKKNRSPKNVKILQTKTKDYERLLSHKYQEIYMLQNRLLSREMGKLKKDKQLDFFVNLLVESVSKPDPNNYTDELYDRVLVQMQSSQLQAKS